MVVRVKDETNHKHVHLILAALVSHTTVCSKLASLWPKQALDSPSADMLSRWAIKHWRAYEEPLGVAVEQYYQQWIEDKQPNEDIVENMTTLINDVYEVVEDGLPASDYILDICERHINAVQLRRQMADAEMQLVDGVDPKIVFANLRTSDEFNTRVKQLELDPDFWEDCFEQEVERGLIKYPGPLGDFIGNAFQRGRFFAWMGPDKVGKYFWLLDAAYRGIRAGLRVAFFECGDMTEREVGQRIGMRSAIRPRFASTIRKPLHFDDKGAVSFEDVTHDQRLLGVEAHAAFEKRLRGRDLFRLVCHPAFSISVEGIQSILMDWAQQGWVADMVVLDYADILAPPLGVQSDNELAKIDHTWMQLRGMSQRLHALVLTATQSSALAYKKGHTVLTRESFSGRKTKLAHVSGMIGLNVTPEDKAQQVTRFNWVVYRHGPYNEYACVHVAGCPAVANPVVVSWKPTEAADASKQTADEAVVEF